ncbi:unnamed protein product [Sphenostylis stenocarpa]|uniref:Polygalacturonase n=1 Tax=Sphenostylis stenocarpa TaxID=92480 RepID=A0AA86STR3_9FABA|nr:unnamed protein product [Sphenostylis stenocarpa]
MIGRLVPKGTDNTEGNVAPEEGADAMTRDGLGLGASTRDGAEVVVGAILFVWACIFSAPTDEEGIGAGAIGIVVFRAQQAHVSHGAAERAGVIGVISLIIILGAVNVKVAECREYNGLSNVEYPAINCRKHSAVLTEFGGVGDGKTSNTKVFRSAISKLSQYASDGGAQLIVPPGKWLTGPFNLTSHFTLFLQKGVVLLASQDELEWPQLLVLPSYGRGRDAPGGRFSSLIFGTNLVDVVITGQNGTIDGQGSYWLDKFHKNQLTLTRPYMIEIMYSDQIQISDLTLVNSASWFVHPIYSSNIIIKGLTILAPVTSPNTDGIDPGEMIEDCYIVSGDDCIAVKSGWDEYGIRFGKPTQHLIIRRVTCISPDSATVALGSEMSGLTRGLPDSPLGHNKLSGPMGGGLDRGEAVTAAGGDCSRRRGDSRSGLQRCS